MGAPPLALSVHNFISSVGADAGFASIIGLAILILLYFAHARETSALREQAARLSERLQQAEAKLAQAGGAPAAAAAAAAQQVGTPATGAAAQPATAAGGVAAARAAAVAVQGAAAGLAAPALASATRFVPVGASTAPAAAPAAAAQDAGSRPVPQPAVTAAVPRPGGATAVASAAVPAVVASSAEARQEPQVPVGAPATAAGASNGGARTAPAAIPGSSLRRAPARPPAASGRGAPAARRPVAPLSSSGPRQSSGGRRFGFLALGALVVAAAVVALIALTSSSGTKSIATLTPTSNAPSATHRAAAAFNPATVTVAVLNGTATNDLAHRVSTKLTALGYRKGAIATATDQTRTATVVAFMPGFRSDAVHVASALRLGPASVRPIDQSTRQVACSGGSTCTANVVVTVGADLAAL